MKEKTSTEIHDASISLGSHRNQNLFYFNKILKTDQEKEEMEHPGVTLRLALPHLFIPPKIKQVPMGKRKIGTLC